MILLARRRRPSTGRRGTQGVALDRRPPDARVAAAAAAASPLGRGARRDVPAGLGRTCSRVRGGSRSARSTSSRAVILVRPRSSRAGEGAGQVEIVAVHDAARPFASPELFARVIQAVADGADGAVPVLAVTDTVLRVRGETVEGTEPRDELALGQTPQAFRTSVLREAHAKADVAGASFTDDASMLRWAGFDVRAIPGDPANVKITTIADLAHADRRMGGDDGLNLRSDWGSTCTPSPRVGSYGSGGSCSKARSASRDTRTVTSCATPSPTRCSGPSRWATSESISRRRLPRRRASPGKSSWAEPCASFRIGARAPVSMDVTVVCDRPQIAPRRGEMRDRLAAISGIPVDRVSVKATRPEGLGLVGDGIGCLALAVVR